MNAIEHLEACAWKTPDSYAGFSPIGDYCILSRHRDANIIDESNWRVALASSDAKPWDNGDDNFEDRPMVYHWRAGHCLVGWVEYLMVRADADEDTLKRAGEIVCALDDYPILDEWDYSELEEEAIQEAWSNLDLRGRYEVIHYRDGERVSVDGKPISIFSIRHDWPPSDDQGYIREQLVY
jgi:hypothetical protein